MRTTIRTTSEWLRRKSRSALSAACRSSDAAAGSIAGLVQPRDRGRAAEEGEVGADAREPALERGRLRGHVEVEGATRLLERALARDGDPPQAGEVDRSHRGERDGGEPTGCGAQWFHATRGRCRPSARLYRQQLRGLSAALPLRAVLAGSSQTRRLGGTRQEVAGEPRAAGQDRVPSHGPPRSTPGAVVVPHELPVSPVRLADAGLAGRPGLAQARRAGDGAARAAALAEHVRSVEQAEADDVRPEHDRDVLRVACPRSSCAARWPRRRRRPRPRACPDPAPAPTALRRSRTSPLSRDSGRWPSGLVKPSASG